VPFRLRASRFATALSANSIHLAPHRVEAHQVEFELPTHQNPRKHTEQRTTALALHRTQKDHSLTPR
jgi:hypothetical protein